MIVTFFFVITCFIILIFVAKNKEELRVIKVFSKHSYNDKFYYFVSSDVNGLIKITKNDFNLIECGKYYQFRLRKRLFSKNHEDAVLVIPHMNT